MMFLRTLIILLLLPICHIASASADTLTFGVVPQQAATKLLKEWAPLLQAAGQQAGVNIHFATAPSIPIFEQRLAAGEYDIAYMNPFHYTVFSDDPGYQAIARADNATLTGILVVQKESTFQNLNDLSNATLAFPAPRAFAATLLTSANLTIEGIPFQSEHVGSHDAVYRGIAAGLYPAGGGIMRTFNTLEPEIRDQLRILWTSPGYTPHAVAVHPRLSEEQRQRIQQALISIRQLPGANELLRPLGINGFIEAGHDNWDDVRALNIQVR